MYRFLQSSEREMLMKAVVVYQQHESLNEQCRTALLITLEFIKYSKICHTF